MHLAADCSDYNSYENETNYLYYYPEVQQLTMTMMMTTEMAIQMPLTLSTPTSTYLHLQQTDMHVSLKLILLSKLVFLDGVI